MASAWRQWKSGSRRKLDKRITGMASVLYDLHMICWLFVWRKSEAVRSGVGVVKNLEPGVILAERKSYLFSPVRDKIWWLFRENTLPQRKKAPDV